MNAAEIKYAFDTKLKALVDVRTELFDTTEISLFMRESELALIMRYYLVFDRSEFEKKVISNLLQREAFAQSSFTTDAFNMDNGCYVQLSTPVLFVLEEHASLQIGTAKVPQIPVKPTSYDSYITNIRNPFRRPDETLVWRMEYNNRKHELITGGQTLLDYHIAYVAKPVPIDLNLDVTSQVNDAFHTEIVEGAVNQALRIIQQRSILAPKSQKQESNQ